MQYRQLGNTGRSLSIVGFGGIVVMDEEPASASRLVAEAIARGITYFDVAPSYGNAEERLGPALAPYRQNVFLACKTGHRDRVNAETELRTSLQRLQTDHFDLYQCHGVTTLDEAERLLSPGGALEAFTTAREAGLIRHIGFSAHSEQAALFLLDRFPFDSVLFPLNWAGIQSGFGRRLLEKAGELGIGVLALKTLAQRPWHDGEERRWRKCWYKPIEDPALAAAAAHFTLSQPLTAALAPGHAELLWLLCDIAEQGITLTPEDEALLTDNTDLHPLFAG